MITFAAGTYYVAVAPRIFSRSRRQCLRCYFVFAKKTDNLHFASPSFRVKNESMT